ncbi:hypothetical protein GCM10007216_11760 [Thalassobacillus devorans]|uniref:ArsR family transcriptional regulator n=1 Tax=Thalassobacillus devorans TaxID=279813 RepID=A0ABQ1NSL2_9BACI|nr:hypothetical protein [Thalassobacillus devorans]NIK28884.1 putative cell wall-binding protein [Thalassobacillus devorans]GGC82863.1 hypothetical protein GCM10007216_11760 [Thalassobacillus devorans]
MKRVYTITLLLLISIFTLSACADAEKSNEGTNNEQPEAAQDKTTGNTKSIKGLFQLQTKNITRLPAEDLVESSLYTSQTIWPATQEENHPNAIILAPGEDWQTTLAAADLIHHPVNGPILPYQEDGLDERVLEEINRLNPLGIQDGTEIILIGNASKKIKDQIAKYQVHQINGETYKETAKNIDDYYADMTEGYPENVIVVSGDDKAKLFSLPVINWIAHMAEPVLFVSGNSVPEETKEALKNRDNPTIYIVGPEKFISTKVESDLGEYGTTERIAGKTAVETSIAFAMYKDEKTGFGWGLEEPGHGVSMISDQTSDYALTAAPFSHLGKHAPLIWLPDGKTNKDLEEFLKLIQPTFKEDPSKGPYNHGFLTGNTEDIPVETQGMIDSMLEIIQSDGDGHAGH